MDKSIIKMTYLAEKEDGTLSRCVEGDVDEKYGEIVSMLYELVGSKQGLKVEKIVFDLLTAYEERAYIEGFKNGFNLNNEIKAIN